MRLCNPDNLIEWQVIEPPKFKKDWCGSLVQVANFERESRTCSTRHISLPPDGGVCSIARRSNDYGGGEFKLELHWHCPACNSVHTAFIPESWIAEGKACFVKAVGIADYTHNLVEVGRPLVYLAAPYSDPIPAKRAARANISSQCAGWLMGKGFSVFSPLSMRHAIAQEAPDIATDFAAWSEPCLRMLEIADAFCVLLLDNLRHSIGLRAELDMARKLGLPCNQITLEEEGFSLLPHPKWWA